MHPTYILQQEKNQTSCKSTEDIFGERTQCCILLEKRLNVVSLFEEMTQCRIFIWLNVIIVGERS